MNNSRTRIKTYASDAIDEMLNAQRKHRSDNWLISYLDVFVLVVMLMVTLLSLTDNNKISAPAKPETKPAKIPAVVVSPKPVVTPPSLATPAAAVPPTPPAPPVSEAKLAEKQLQTELEEKIKRMGLNQAIALKVSQGYAQIDIQNKVLFRSSDAELTEAGKTLLAQIIPMLKESEGLIIIEGHTDNRPIHTARFMSNWELSAARANSVLHFLASEAIDPARLHTSGFADTKPLADNDTPEGREKNRRVNIMIKVNDKLQQLDINN